jgi:hypothetical protein
MRRREFLGVEIAAVPRPSVDQLAGHIQHRRAGAATSESNPVRE